MFYWQKYLITSGSCRGSQYGKSDGSQKIRERALYEAPHLKISIQNDTEDPCKWCSKL